MSGIESLTEFRAFLTDVRMRAANQVTEYVCAGHDPEDRDPADVHEDVREAMWPFFLEIQEKVMGPECSAHVQIGRSSYAKCDLLEGHKGNHHPCVGTPYVG
jgi:hypothetical protein